ncbi:MAG: hypothetical protein ABII09_03080 [Planctomycetota bacterium]
MIRTREKISLAAVFGLMVILGSIEVSQAARWQYHAFRRGWVTVWGTRNCRIVTRPLVYRRYMQYCQHTGGYLPWYCNDWMVRHEWGWPCYNVTWRKYVAPPCPHSCWWNRWYMGDLDTYLGRYVPEAYAPYGITSVVIPTVGDPNGHLTGNQHLFIFTDVGQWLDGTVGAGMPYVPLPDGADPNERYYNFSGGESPDLPGFIVMRVDPPETPVETLIVFDPNADPAGYPFVVTRTDLLFSGRLYLQSDDTFSPEEYNGYLMHGDPDWSGESNFQDFSPFADMWLQTNDTAGPLPEVPITDIGP